MISQTRIEVVKHKQILQNYSASNMQLNFQPQKVRGEAKVL